MLSKVYGAPEPVRHRFKKCNRDDMRTDRFAYLSNVKPANHYRGWRNAFWPAGDDYRVFFLDIIPESPSFDSTLFKDLEALRWAVEANWQHHKAGGAHKRRMHDPALIAECLRRIAVRLPGENDRLALELRADAVERGYNGDTLLALAGMTEDITIVAGTISTWFGKEMGGLPTAFGCVSDSERQSSIRTGMDHLDDIRTYARSIQASLRIGEVPAFAAARLFFMAGEGNRHPKHIAYFLPEDEGVKYSPFKKTYHFTNTHCALLNAISLPLARRFLNMDKPPAANAMDLYPIPVLGVWAHEVGHFVHREGVSFAELNAADRWASVTLQEMAADVFGTLALAQVLSEVFDFTVADVISYHLAECLRYVDRGLGFFPDSDGMYLQLNYLVSFGAMTVESHVPRLCVDPDVVVAGFRSMARVLADTLLAGDVKRALSFHRSYGPGSSDHLAPLINALREESPKTIEYLQERPEDKSGDSRGSKANKPLREGHVQQDESQDPL